VKLTFDQLEEVLGRALPSSARSYPAWWSDGRSHTTAWRQAGWTVGVLDLKQQQVTFGRA
jgi:hypothetical protein